MTKTISTCTEFLKKINPRLRPFYLLLGVVVLSSHDLYLKMDSYFLEPNQQATLQLYNGTFERSENVITRDRMLDASFVGQGVRKPIDPAMWKDQDSTITYVSFDTDVAGTYMAGVSTKARNLEQTADKFNDYLRHDGVLDMLQYRKDNDLLDQDVVESYEKHVKAIYQVGDVTTDDWAQVLGYPIEFVPQKNPYETYSGQSLEVQLLLDGQPLSNQLVYADRMAGPHGHTHGDKADHEHGHSHDDHDAEHQHQGDELQEAHSHTGGQQLRTDANGMVTVDLPEDGIYYLRTIHMREVTDDAQLTHRSKWATLTFEVTHEHGKDTHTHEEHAHEEGLPTWMFILGSFLVIVLLFFVFRKKS